MQIEQLRQKNGLETLFINSPGATAACVQIWFRAGSALEQKSEQGIAHFLEHMFFKGTKTRPGAEIARSVESFGGEINAFTSFDYTCYYINTPTNYLKNTIEILMDMVSSPLFSQDELIPERDVVFEEYRRALDSPSQFAFKELQKSAFTNGYGHQILGTEKTIKNFTKEQLINFRNKYYNLSNALLVVAGDIKDKKTIEKTISSFKIPDGQHSTFPKFKLKSKPSINIHEKQVNQTVLTCVIQAPEYLSAESAQEDLAVNCLAFGELSPLYKELVTETNFASSASGSTMFFSRGGAHFIKMAFPTENFSKVVDSFEKTIERIVNKGFSDNEVQRIKSQYIASKIYERESIEAFAFSLGHGFAQTGNIHCDEDFITSIKETNTNAVNTGLVNIFAKNAHITIQVPENTKNKNKYKERITKLQSKLLNISKNAQSKQAQQSLIVSAYDPEVKLIEIKKGIKLLYRQNKMTPTFVFHSYIKGGLTNETEENNGSFYFLSRLITYGYKGKNFEDIKTDLEFKSSYLSGFSGKNAYGLTLHGQTEHFNDLMNHFEQTLINPSFPAKYLQIEKKLINRAIVNQKEDPVKQCFKAVGKMVFNKHPYEQEIIGNEKTIKKISRKSLSDIHNTQLTKSEMVFTYCGNLDMDTVVEKIKSMTKTLPGRKSTKPKKKTIKPLFGQKLKIDFDREQSHIFIGRPSYKVGAKEDLYLKMLTSYLAGQSSELFVEVRDRLGLCYAVQPLQHTALEAGYWGIYIGAGHDKVESATAAILNIINKLKTKGLPKTEFNRIKKMIDGQNQLNIQTNDDYANFYSIPVLHGLGLDYQHKSFETIRNFDHKDFNAFLGKFLDTKWNTIEVGP